MNYQKSQQILDEVKKAKRILLNCHYGADPDGIGSTLALKLVLEKLGKKVDVICPSKKLSQQTNFLTGFNDITLGIDFYSFDFDKYDLCMFLDTSDVDVLTGQDRELIINKFIVVIDHHQTFHLKNDLKILDTNSSSVGEILYKVFKDWNIELDQQIAECLLTSIIGDTGTFSYTGATSETLRIGSDLMSLGADKSMISDRIYRGEDFRILKFWAEVLSRIQIDKEYGFVWSTVPNNIYKDYEDLPAVKSKTASIFAPIVDGTDFGFIGIEEKPNTFTVSFRGRTDFDTSRIAEELGGGGHPISSAVRMEDINFDDAVEKVLTVCRKYANKKV
ncbi:hypothetical protein A2130_02395 [Candidatus Woesebacteria bacterium GWC2_33_12]|uniref:DHH subfamily 1 protein n=1 Tax=Candidatus Woesebacteria bacterium GW2011_GWB1_33_22 TaxID=1618566 RepID=A0A0F9ZMN1_9BACT|nr:MAG: DHH subfamily 1 protein [Candidatus Woesebacteria bacterium GW2011_GWC2_33_12]KKP42807.1 MAG: DHH subfamily 1 protein [Candidatus Woesebacteria bacterium GW2011_GWA2_33_20]KKP45419.1 MAG: DHH subfamily 1 protein [Candidatus Woesebacteria bacterium GW2011_GWB1_33_22]KKP46260.1 MAG: Phosphoesterase RecJ domain protein [Microgenomates group bacterium GW2011_GWC1_33_28]KKP50369.1 MAG: DHH subfamily 1 protein [Candidatus Woesebacteria bacterium GW2011_GWA1_33_33]OGM07873.1 MAG: hypothetical